jgi:ankyrin repeat protein
MSMKRNGIIAIAAIAVVGAYLIVHFKVSLHAPESIGQSCMHIDARGKQENEQALTNNVERGRTVCVEYLLGHGSNPNEGEGNLYTPLMATAQYGRTQEARMLIQAGADVNFMGVNGPPLCRALRNQSASLDLVVLFVNSGAHLTWSSGSALGCLGDYNGRETKFNYLLNIGILHKMTREQIESSLPALSASERNRVNSLIR